MGAMIGQLLKIMAEPQIEAEKCKFILEKPIVEGSGSYTFTGMGKVAGSALAEAIFAAGDVAEIFVSANQVLVTMKLSTDWRNVGPKVGAAIRAALTSGKPAINPGLKNELPSESTIRNRVQKILEDEINPSVAAHGGYIELLDVKMNDIFIKMGGGCQGCAASTATLKQGVEKALREAVPGLGAIYDTTDHAAGLNPYYQP